MRVLLVEDNSLTRELETTLLREAGHDVTGAANGLEALDFLGAGYPEVPDVIVLDLRMPALCGFRFLTALRRREAWQTVPVLVTTAAAESEVRELQSHTDLLPFSVLRKPYDPLDLLQALRAHILGGGNG